jgi:hypothetical protein
MNTTPDTLRLPRMSVNLSVVRGHYARVYRCHTRAACRAAQYTAIRDISVLVAEVERLWELACAAQQRYADLRAAALASIAAYDASEPDPLFYLRDELHARTPQPPDPGGRR